MIIIANGNLITCAEENYVQKDILIEEGKIRKIGDIDKELYSKAEVFDAEGRYVTPGLMDPHCHIGILEEAIRREGADVNETTDPSTPHLRGYDAVYPFDVSFKDALENGVTTVATGPGSANVIGGVFCVLKTVGTSVEEMTVKQESAIKMALGENPKFFYGDKSMAPATRMASAGIMRTELIKAREYHEKLKKEESKPDYDPKMASLCRVFDGFPVKIHAHRTDDIQTAMRIAEEFGLNYTIEHCTEGHLIADELARRGARVIVGPSMGTKSKYELRNKTYKTAGILEKAGVPFSLMTDHPVMALADTKIQTALMIREGLTELTALKAMTINPARFNGVADRVGSIEPGKDADVVIWTHNPFDAQCRASKVFVNGELVHSL